MHWDGRFRAQIMGKPARGSSIAALGRAGPNCPEGAGHPDYAGLHREVRYGLPALYVRGELAARPHFDPVGTPGRKLCVRFMPSKPLAGAAFGKV